MIRDSHAYRAGIHDRLLRKLTGRSCSTLVHPVVRDHPVATMRICPWLHAQPARRARSKKG